MITPDYLKPGDKIGVIAPARKVTEAEMEPGIRYLKEKGFEVVTGKNLYNSHHQFSGNDNERAADLQAMIDDKSVRAIIAARGGYGSVRIIDQVEMDPLMEDPKWICGFSDMTVFHNHLHHYLGMESIHSCMMYHMQPDLFDTASVDSLMNALTGEKSEYTYDTAEHVAPLNRAGESEGILVGGNLSLLYAMHGTASDIDTRGKILFLEDLDEYLYHLDRMMMSLKRTGKLDHLVGLVVGSMLDMKDNTVPFGKSAEEIIREHVQEFEYPVCFDFPSGHSRTNLALILGREVDLFVHENQVKLNFREVEAG